jgi:hypothetical protein
MSNQPDTPIDFNQLKLLPDICSYCQRPFTESNRKTFDHIIPCCKTGIHRNTRTFETISNLIICCYKCNQMKANRSLIEWYKCLDGYKICSSRVNRAKYKTNIRIAINLLLSN